MRHTRKWIAEAVLSVAFLGGLETSAFAQEDTFPIEAFRDALESPDAILRLEALRQVQAIVRRPDAPSSAKSLVPDVSDLLWSDPNPVLRREAVRTLAAYRSDEALTALHQSLDSPDSAVRYEAVRGLGGVGDQSSIDHLEPLLADPAPHVRREAFLVLSRLASDLARKGPSPRAPALPRTAPNAG